MYNFKKIALSMLLVLSLICLLMTGCSSSGNEAKPVYLQMGTGGTGGVFYPIGVGIASILGEKTNFEVSVEATKASVENNRLLDAGQIDIGMASFPTSIKAVKGDAPFEKPIPVCALFQMYENPVHLIVMKDSAIKEINDLKGKKISVGNPGSGNKEVADAFFQGVLGWQENVDYVPYHLSYTESVEAFKTGQIDAALFDTPAPTSSIIDLASWKPIRLLSVPANLLNNAQGYAQNFVMKTIPSGVYLGVDEPVETIAHGNWLIARQDMPEEYGYTIVKTIFENLPEIEKVHAVAKELTPELGARTGGMPLHSGAEKYFKEIGVIK